MIFPEICPAFQLPVRAGKMKVHEHGYATANAMKQHRRSNKTL